MRLFGTAKIWTKALFCVLILSCVCARAGAQDIVSDTLRLSVCFQRGSSQIDLSYRNNAANFAAFRDSLDQRLQKPGGKLRIIIVTAFSSPEGRTSLNQTLSESRAQAIKDYLKDFLGVEDDAIHTEALGEDWDGLYRLVLDCDQPWTWEVAYIIKFSPNRKQELRALQDGAVWAWMEENLFPRLRGANGTVVAIIDYLPVPEPEPEPEPEPVPEPVPVVIPAEEPESPEPLPIVVQQPKPAPGLYLYNNLALDALLVVNLGLEADLSKHWSIAVPAFYSGWNWFDDEYTKFRCLGIRPEIRCYPFSRHVFYVGAHACASYFNIAFNPLSDTYRYQDTDGKMPLYGGGLDMGFKIPLSKRLSLMLSAGAGVYALDYDMFYLGVNGRQAYAGQKQTYIGPDYLQLSLVYRFNRLTRKEKK